MYTFFLKNGIRITTSLIIKVLFKENLVFLLGGLVF
jgi:hypothetical protein